MSKSTVDTANRVLQPTTTISGQSWADQTDTEMEVLAFAQAAYAFVLARRCPQATAERLWTDLLRARDVQEAVIVLETIATFCHLPEQRQKDVPARGLLAALEDSVTLIPDDPTSVPELVKHLREVIEAHPAGGHEAAAMVASHLAKAADCAGFNLLLEVMMKHLGAEDAGLRKALEAIPCAGCEAPRFLECRHLKEVDPATLEAAPAAAAAAASLPAPAAAASPPPPVSSDSKKPQPPWADSPTGAQGGEEVPAALTSGGTAPQEAGVDPATVSVNCEKKGRCKFHHPGRNTCTGRWPKFNA